MNEFNNDLSSNKNINNNPTISHENSDSVTAFEDKSKVQSLEESNFNTLLNVCSKEDSIFKKHIEKLNQKLSSENNKFSAIKAELEKSHENIFTLMFKKISIYVEEVEKLNAKLKEKDEIVKFYKTKVDEVYSY